MIRLLWLDGMSCPVFICDWCGKEINTPGNYLWELDDKGNSKAGAVVNQDSEPHNAEVVTLHKECTHAFEMANGRQGNSRFWSFDELEKLPSYLAFNAKIGISKVKKHYAKQIPEGI